MRLSALRQPKRPLISDLDTANDPVVKKRARNARKRHRARTLSLERDGVLRKVPCVRDAVTKHPSLGGLRISHSLAILEAGV